MSARTNVYILLVSVAGQHFFKCGIAEDLDKRICQLQTGNPHEIEFVHAVSCPTKELARVLERDVHGYLARFRTKGEWFCCTFDDIVEALHAAFYVNHGVTKINSMAQVMKLLTPRAEVA